VSRRWTSYFGNEEDEAVADRADAVSLWSPTGACVGAVEAARVVGPATDVDVDVGVDGVGGVGVALAPAAVATPAINGAIVNAMAIAATSAPAGRWKAPRPGSVLAGFLRTVAVNSGRSEAVNSAQQIHTPAARTTATSWPLSFRRRSVPTWCSDGMLRGTRFSFAISIGTPTTTATSTMSAPMPRSSRPTRLAGLDGGVG